ncbi:MAG: regulatory protein RecX [Clostridia bacterium]|nr:regulatory protein RecX [Clostridia bacterium]
MNKKQNDNRTRSKQKGNSAYEEALHFLTPKARTVREVENRLDECDHSEMEIFEAVERLKNAGLLDDEKYAADFIESRLNTKPVSKMKLREQLAGHFIDSDTIYRALSAVTDENELANARAVAEKYYRQFAGLEPSERIRRVGLRLTSRGYSYDDVKTVLSELNEDE